MRVLLFFFAFSQALWVVEYTYSRIVPDMVPLYDFRNTYEKASGFKVFHDKSSALRWVNNELDHSFALAPWYEIERRPKDMEFVALHSTIVEHVAFVKVGEREEIVNEPKSIKVDIKKWV